MYNILYVSNQSYFNGGAPRTLYEILESLDRKKINPFFASVYEDDLADKIKKINVPFLRLNECSYPLPFFALSSVVKMVRFIRDNDIHLIHNNQCDDALYSWLPAKLTRTPIIIHHRDPSFYKHHRFLSNHVDANISISNWQNEHNLKGKGIVIHNGIDLKKFFFLEKSPLSGPNDKIKVGVLGRIVYIKGQDIFVKAASLIAKEHPNIEFLIVGDDQDKYYLEYIQQVKNLVKTLGIEKQVLFTGPVQSCVDILPQLDISVIPSRKEPFGRVIIESIACEKPVIATSIWGALDIVTPETGILVPPDDPEKLAEAILLLVNSSDKRRRMGEAGYNHVRKYFTKDQMMDKIYRLYDDLLTQPGCRK
jgi:glycosyltransferase involved in cell wall biosynthesis